MLHLLFSPKGCTLHKRVNVGKPTGHPSSPDRLIEHSTDIGDVESCRSGCGQWIVSNHYPTVLAFIAFCIKIEIHEGAINWFHGSHHVAENRKHFETVGAALVYNKCFSCSTYLDFYIL